MKQTKHRLPLISEPAPCSEPMQMLRLCKICRVSEERYGLRRCSRVVAESPKTRALLARTAIVAATQSAVLVHGETGTGKEIIARLVHANSAREQKPFHAINVAALPPELLESELFGHVKGAFTGAVETTKGLFGEADGGTLLLDEIGEMPLSLQAKLLRVLQEGEIRRVGETRSRRVDVRVVSATHRDLKALVRAGRFREDLYYRLVVLALAVPPLRERREDLFPLAQMFATKLGVTKLAFTTRARKMLEAHEWPGNVRELGNVVEHALAFAQGGPIDVEHLPEAFAPISERPRDEDLLPLAAVERAHVERVLRACGGNQVQAAKILRIGRSTLWRKLVEGTTVA